MTRDSSLGWRTLFGSEIQATTISVEWCYVPSFEKRNNTWIWLQQLGLARHDGVVLQVARHLEPYVLDAGFGSAPLSQAELDLRLQSQRRRAVLAEEHIVLLEKTRLRDAGVPELADAIMRVSDNDVAPGFDILSFGGNGEQRFIEVKSSSGLRRWFVWSLNEYRCAVHRQDAYWIAWVGWSARLPGGPSEVAWFRNPATLLRSEDSPWVAADSDLIVRMARDDIPFTVDA